VTAAVGLLVAALVAVMPYARRPKVSLEEDEARIQSRVEMSEMGACRISASSSPTPGRVAPLRERG
jgi:hypothetical protein